MGPARRRIPWTRILGVIAASILILGIAAWVPARRVTRTDMAWTFQPNDVVWLVPDRIRKADVVSLADPLDPSRTVLRRVVAVAGDNVRIEEGRVRVNAKPLRQTEMGDRPGLRVRKEVIWSKPPARANGYFVQVVVPEVPWSSPGIVEVPEGHVYVLADNRDQALDSRWWGPVPETSVKGVVRAVWGEVNEWREAPFGIVLPEE